MLRQKTLSKLMILTVLFTLVAGACTSTADVVDSVTVVPASDENTSNGSDLAPTGTADETGREVELTGTVTAITAEAWTIDEQVVLLDIETEIEESITTGSIVTIHAQLAADGSLTASEIDLADDDDSNTNDDDDDANANDDDDDANDDDDDDDSNANVDDDDNSNDDDDDSNTNDDDDSNANNDDDDDSNANDDDDDSNANDDDDDGNANDDDGDSNANDDDDDDSNANDDDDDDANDDDDGDNDNDDDDDDDDHDDDDDDDDD